jgi:hypothetical protein
MLPSINLCVRAQHATLRCICRYVYITACDNERFGFTNDALVRIQESAAQYLLECDNKNCWPVCLLCFFK